MLGISRTFMSIVAAVALAVTAPVIVSAHSILIESTPKHGATLTVAPQSVSFRFNAKIEPALTKVSLVDNRKHKTPLEVSSDSTIDRIVVRVPPLGPGVYTVVYKVLATDGHITQGSIRFTILAS